MIKLTDLLKEEKISQPEIDYIKIQSLKEGETYTIPESDYGKADVEYRGGLYYFYEIPQFGGEPYFFGKCNLQGLKDMIEEIYNLT